MGKTTDVQYWPLLIWQWIMTIGGIGSVTTVGIGNIITAKSLKSLKRKDQRNAWRMTHASAAMRSADREMVAKISMQVLTALKQRGCLSLYAAKDRDGDTPLHSVVKTGDANRLKILLTHLPPKLLRNILEMPNKLGQTPLKVAFDQEEWDMLELLLDYCIRNGLCSTLTGVGENLPASTTLLHHAMDKGCCRFVETYFDVTAKNHEYGKPGLLVYDHYGRTPWFYLMNHKDSKILGSILRTLRKHNIDVNELVADKFSRSTMLHLAYQKKRQECIQLLLDEKADPGKKDMRGLRADERDHLIGGRQKRPQKCQEQVAQDQQQDGQSMQSAQVKAPPTASGSHQMADSHNGRSGRKTKKVSRISNLSSKTKGMSQLLAFTSHLHVGHSRKPVQSLRLPRINTSLRR